MLTIQKVEEPAFFSDFIKESKPKKWDDFKPIRTSLREFILEQEQTVSGVPLCTYCEKKVSLDDSHIDHIRPKDEAGKYAKLFDKYPNLTVSCKSPKSCGQAKDNDYDDRFINPVEENPTDFMTYEIMTGKVVAVASSKQERVERTCDILQLNDCMELLNARKKVLNSFYRCSDKGASSIDYFREFPTLIEFYRQAFLT